MNWVLLGLTILTLGLLFVTGGEILNRIEDLKHWNRQILERLKRIEKER